MYDSPSLNKERHKLYDVSSSSLDRGAYQKDTPKAVSHHSFAPFLNCMADKRRGSLGCLIFVGWLILVSRWKRKDKNLPHNIINIIIINKIEQFFSLIIIN
jgi:hypothetical protein